MIPMSLGGKRKSHRARSGEKGGCCSTAMFFSARNCRMLRMLSAGALLWWSSHNLSCHNSRTLTHWAKQKPQDLCRLADWSSGPVARTHCGILWHRRMWSTWLWLLILTVLLSLASATSETSADSSGIWFLGHTQNPCLTTSDDYKASLVQFEDARWCPDTPAGVILLIIINQSWAIFAKTFRMRGGVNKSMWNKIQWLQKAKIWLQLYTPKIPC